MRKTYARAAWTALMGSAALLLTACDGGAANAPARDHASNDAAVSTPADRSAPAGGDRASAREDHRKDPVVLLAGKPIWANSKKYSAQESAEYHFKQDGADFGAKSLEDYVAKARTFVGKPPKGVLTLTRDNGDRLLYDARSNTFAVVTKDGEPRTMFKPHDGSAYWDKQKQREADEAKGGDDSGGRYSRRASRRGSDDSDG